MSTIIRIQHDNRYFTVSNALFNDARLTFEARGVMGYLLSKPDGWETRVSDLIAQSPAGRHVIRRIMKELQDYGYLHRQKVRTKSGQFTWVSVIYESPQNIEEEAETDHSPIPAPGTGEKSNQGRFSVDGSSVDGGVVDIVNTDIVNTDIYLSSPGGEEDTSSEKGGDLEDVTMTKESEGEELRPITQPYGIFQRLSSIEPGIPKGQTLRDAKVLLRGDDARKIPGYSGEDIVACAEFLATDPWRQRNMVPLSSDTIVKKIAKWVLAGKPKNWAEYKNGTQPAAQATTDFVKNNADFLPVIQDMEEAGYVM